MTEKIAAFVSLRKIYKTICLNNRLLWLMLVSLTLLNIPAAAQQSYGTKPQAGEIIVAGKKVPSLELAFKMVEDEGYIYIGPGIYKQAGVLNRNGVTIMGSDGTHFKDTTIKGKATFLIRGNNTNMINIECSGAKVQHKNGSCIRLEGQNLRLNKVYFHDSQSGILAGGNQGNIEINNSRFERIGHGGRSHAIYVNGGRLAVRRSIFLSAKDQAHELKSRAELTILQNNLFASLDGNDSRLVDIPNGGEVIIKGNLFVEGPKTVNYQIFSWGVEGVKHQKNSFIMENNMIVSDRKAGSVFLGKATELPPIQARANVFIGRYKDQLPDGNAILKSRDDYGFAPHPAIPYWPPADRVIMRYRKSQKNQ